MMNVEKYMIQKEKVTTFVATLLGGGEEMSKSAAVLRLMKRPGAGACYRRGRDMGDSVLTGKAVSVRLSHTSPTKKMSVDF